MTCKRRIQFCAGHRVFEHEGKCKNIHGHNYVLWIYARTKELDALGRVIDFSVLKEKIGTWIDENFDHTFIVYKNDTIVEDIVRINKKKPYILDSNPTAENIALHLLYEIIPPLMADTGITVYKLELFETENCAVEVSLA
ncbi:MAG: 6-carboxytetrahydropterin synthase [Candidatus Sericytochromatia bacterium]|nr:6-carboxytetrahydropterin synthase [Candidatus Sericytochromatia bacterium]